ncbi:MAG: hypothetical protein WDN30_14710 [Pararobbsia sp.]
MTTRVRSLANSLDGVATIHTALADRQRAELHELERRAAAMAEYEADLGAALAQLFEGPLRVSRAGLFDLRRRGAALRSASAELRANAALLHGDVERLQAAIEGERRVATTLLRRRDRLLRWADIRSRTKRITQEQRMQNEVEEWSWRMYTK